MFVIMSMLSEGTHYLTLGLSQVTLGLVFNIIAIRQDQNNDEK